MHATRRLFVRLVAVFTVVAAMFATALWPVPAAGQVGLATNGFVLLGGDGGIFPFGVPMAGAAASNPNRCAANAAQPNGTCVSMAVTPSGMGYWILDTGTGAVYPFGTAGFYGDPATVFAHSERALIPNPLQIVATPDGKGYWVYGMLSGLGHVHEFGDAGSFGSTFASFPWGTGHPHFNGHPVAMAATPTGGGYWEVWSDGGVFAYGDAKFYGSTGGIHLAQAVIGITATADGKGYWLVAADGGVFAFGDAVFGGSAAGMHLNAPIVGMTRNPAGPGYWLAAADGGIFGFGGAPWSGSIPQYGIRLHRPIVAIATKRTSVG